MSNEELVNILGERLTRLESKLDTHLSVVQSNKTDISWIKGHIRTGLAIISTMILAVLSVFFKLFMKD